MLLQRDCHFPFVIALGRCRVSSKKAVCKWTNEKSQMENEDDHATYFRPLTALLKK
jgi:hypothetical protein